MNSKRWYSAPGERISGSLESIVKAEVFHFQCLTVFRNSADDGLWGASGDVGIHDQLYLHARAIDGGQMVDYLIHQSADILDYAGRIQRRGHGETGILRPGRDGIIRLVGFVGLIRRRHGIRARPYRRRGIIRRAWLRLLAFLGLLLQCGKLLDKESAAVDVSHILIILEANIAVLGFPFCVGEVFLRVDAVLDGLGQYVIIGKAREIAIGAKHHPEFADGNIAGLAPEQGIHLHEQKRRCPLGNELLVLLHFMGGLGYDGIRAAANADHIPNDGLEVNLAVNVGNEQMAIGFKNPDVDGLVAARDAVGGFPYLGRVQIQILAILLDGYPRQVHLDGLAERSDHVGIRRDEGQHIPIDSGRLSARVQNILGGLDSSILLRIGFICLVGI